MVWTKSSLEVFPLSSSSTRSSRCITYSHIISRSSVERRPSGEDISACEVVMMLM
jgi:hypothetical protein